MKIEAKLEELGLTLPAAPTPMANYVTCRQVGNLLFFSGAGPFEEGKPVVFGKVGGELTQEQGYAAARLTGLNLIAQLRKELGDLDRIKQFVKVQAFVASVQPAGLAERQTCGRAHRPPHRGSGRRALPPEIRRPAGRRPGLAGPRLGRG